MDLKGSLLGSRNFRVKRLTVKVWDPDANEFAPREIGVRQVTLAQRAEIGNDSVRASTADEKAKAHAKVVAFAACDPDTGKRLFDGNDLKGLVEQAAAGWVEEVAMAALEMMSLPVQDVLCKEPLRDAQGMLVLDGPDKGKSCGCKLVPGERYCPRCGREVPPVMEQVRGS